MPTLLASAGFAIVLGTWMVYLVRIPKEKVPVRPIGSVALLVIGIGCCAAAIWQARNGLTLGLGSVAIGLAAFFFYLLRLAPLPDGELVVRIGDVLPAFEARSPEGESWSSTSLSGERVLLKFFRGGW